MANTIRDLICKRKNYFAVNNENRDIIGIEIKHKRINQQNTLEGVSMDLCSPSYLCKIERNQIQANQYILQEICNRVDISEKQQKMLFHFYQIMLEGAKSFLENDVDKLKKYVDVGAGFENYRYKILLLMYYIATNNLTGANMLVNEFMKIIPVMLEKDLAIYSLFCGILKYYEKDYYEAIYLLETIDTKQLNDDLLTLFYEYLFYSFIMVGSVYAPYFYEDLISQLTATGLYEKIEYINYAFGVYAVKFDAGMIFERIKSSIRNEKYKNTLIVFDALKRKDYDTLREYKKKDCNEFCKTLFGILDKNEGEMELVMHSTTALDSFDYSINYLKYLLLKEPQDKIAFIQKQYEYYCVVNDVFMIKFFISEILRLPPKQGIKNYLKKYLLLLKEYEKK